jgi:hypothetical protein
VRTRRSGGSLRAGVRESAHAGRVSRLGGGGVVIPGRTGEPSNYKGAAYPASGTGREVAYRLMFEQAGLLSFAAISDTLAMGLGYRTPRFV